MPTAAPSPRVLAAFGTPAGRPRLLVGGRGTTWRVHDLVVRPSESVEETEWRSGVLAGVRADAAFRTPRPVPTVTGDWTVDGWEAWRWMPGAADERRVAEVIRAGTAFHAAVAHLPRPDVLDHTDDPWRRADRMVWDGVVPARIAVLDRLAAAFVPVTSPSQLIHGDLLGNVMFAPGGPPTIIDWSPYWRPAGLGAAIAAVDAVCWHDHPASSLEVLGAGTAEWRQLLIRALAFRIATLHLVGAWDRGQIERHTPVATAVLGLGDAVGPAADR